ncbi:HupE/UreJ family protein [Methylorubrum salsuginis]|uniref:Urease accessory protein n=1 Tax=Methylorubrum salsuginis TaxID=414703 RepID=A0A1I3YKJ0_9HYPH|nr:HupE/UreJ family protein [Methylorubrum salsuginis]SFK32344.1 urease accessory protein [Methylorubrum salsuginis]
MTFRSLVPAAALVLLPGAALAHPGHGEAMGWAAGFAHPIGGADHVLAMVAVGVIAGLVGGRALWLLPAAFLGMMSAGAGAAIAGLDLPFVEPAILASVAAFAVMAVCARLIPLAALAGLVGAFAVFHGAAHGAEMPETASGFAYGLGFLAATTLLHAVGLAAGLVLTRILPKSGTAART